MIFLELFFTFLKIGAFTFGGGYAMLPLIQQEVVSHQWMTLEQLVNFIAVSESTPGPLAVNLSTYVGAETGGLLGALCATFGVVLPSFVIILVVAKFYQAFQSNTVVKGCMNGLRPTVVGMIGASLLSVAASAFPASGGVLQWGLAGVLLAAILIAHWKKVHPILLIAASAAAGIAAGYAGLLPGVKRPTGGRGKRRHLSRCKEGLSQGMALLFALPFYRAFSKASITVCSALMRAYFLSTDSRMCQGA